MADPLVCLGVVLAAHGINGLVKIKSFTEPAEKIFDYRPLRREDGEAWAVKRSGRDGLLLQVPGIADRTAAAALKGQKLFVFRSQLPTATEGEYYQTDLIGLGVETEAGQSIGTVVALANFGAGDLLEVKEENGASAYIPFADAFVPEVDLAGRRLVVRGVEVFLNTRRAHGSEV